MRSLQRNEKIMSSSRVLRLGAAVVLALGVALPAAHTAAAAPDTGAATGPEASPKITLAMSAAMQRDLHLSADAVQDRLEQEAAAARAEQTARARLGTSYAGSWFDAASATLVVHTTGQSTLEDVAGVTVRRVTHGGAELDAAKRDLDSRSAPAAVTGWYVDTRSNSVVITLDVTKADAAAKAFVADALARHPSARVVEETTSPAPLADIVGAYPYYINWSSRCSIGFTVTTGFVSAGHCGTPGSTATDGGGALLGTFQGSVFPGRDYSYVGAAGGTYLYGYVYGYNGYYYYVRGSSEMPEGASVCRSGSTTGMWCGTIQAKNQTVNYPQGTVYGLTRTNVCAEPGDSGGSWLSANQAQGVTSGGSGNCSFGGTTFFQPVNPILSAYGLSLVLT